MKRFLKIAGIVVAALFVIGIFGAIVNPEGDTTASSDEGSTASEAVAEESEPTVESEPVAEPEPEPEPEETKEPEPSTEPEPEPEPAQEQPEPEPAPESELKQGNETAYLSTIDSLAKSDEFPWLTEDSPILAGNDVDEWLVIMGYGICENLEALDEPVTLEDMDADMSAYAESQGYSAGEMGALYVSTEHLCPKAYEKLPES